MTPWIIFLLTVLAILWLGKLQSPWLQRFFDWVPSILLAYLFPALVCGIFGWDFSADPIHGWSRKIFIPLAIVTVMSSLSLGKLKAVGWRPLALFVSGSAWIAVFPVLVLSLALLMGQAPDLFDDPDYWLGVPPVVGSWIGGSTSQLVLKELADCPESVFLSVLVLDALLVNLWTVFMFQAIRRSDRVNRWLGIHKTAPPPEIQDSTPPNANTLLTVLVIAATVWLLQALSDRFALQVIALSVAGLLLGNGVRGWNRAFALRMGSITILCVMAILGFRLRLESLSFDPGFFWFLVVWLISHFVVMLALARLLHVHAAWVPIASMANVGGIATAPAVTAAYRPQWMPHAVLLAILSMATGTFWGMLTLEALRFLLT